jgi:hypothetical protein
LIGTKAKIGESLRTSKTLKIFTTRKISNKNKVSKTASQAYDEGSIPFTRSKISHALRRTPSLMRCATFAARAVRFPSPAPAFPPILALTPYHKAFLAQFGALGGKDAHEWAAILSRESCAWMIARNHAGQDANARLLKAWTSCVCLRQAL